MGWRKKLKKAKQLHRPELKNWEIDELYQVFSQYVAKLQKDDNDDVVVVNSSTKSSCHQNKEVVVEDESQLQQPNHKKQRRIQQEQYQRYNDNHIQNDNHIHDIVDDHWENYFYEHAQQDHPQGQFRCYHLPPLVAVSSTPTKNCSTITSTKTTARSKFDQYDDSSNSNPNTNNNCHYGNIVYSSSTYGSQQDPVNKNHYRFHETSTTTDNNDGDFMKTSSTTATMNYQEEKKENRFSFTTKPMNPSDVFNVVSQSGSSSSDNYHSSSNSNHSQEDSYTFQNQTTTANKQENMYQPSSAAPTTRTTQTVPAVLDAKTLTKEEFWYQYEQLMIPCIIKNIPYGYDDGKIQPSTNDSVGSPVTMSSTTTTKTTASTMNMEGRNNASSTQLHSNQNREEDTEHRDVIPAVWPAVTKWNLKTLMQPKQPDDEDKSSMHDHDNEKYIDFVRRIRNRKFKCGEDDDGKAIKVRLKYFFKYLQYNVDDSPLYVFDSSFERDKRAKALLKDYNVPSYFANDLFTGLISEQRRPPYRWILMGPERSGSTVHIDPLATNAWNTLLQGKKRWVLFPPHIPKHIVKGKGLINHDTEDDEAIHYFMYILPRILKNAHQQYTKYSKYHQKADDHHHRDNDRQQKESDIPAEFQYDGFTCIEFTQHAGETVFVPNGWWHAVLNLTDTVGVTQNYVSERNFINVWYEVRKERKRMAYKWLQNLKIQYPHLYTVAIKLNEQDQFRMKYDPHEIKLRQEQEKERQRQKQLQKQATTTTHNNNSYKQQQMSTNENHKRMNEFGNNKNTTEEITKKRLNNV